MHILVVDDEEDVRILFEQRFRREMRTNQMTFHFVASGEAALEYIEHERGFHIVLILADINMPGMNGLELLQRIKAYHAPMKVFVITAYVDEYHRHTAMQYGADDYVAKPVDFNELKQKIQVLADA